MIGFLVIVGFLNNSQEPAPAGAGTRIEVVGKGPARVLAYSDDWKRASDQTKLYRALSWLNTNLGYTFVYHYSSCNGAYANFLNDLWNNGPWDLVAVDHPSCQEFSLNAWDDLYNWVQAGGKLVMSEFDTDGDQSYYYPAFWNLLGVNRNYDLGTAHDINIWDYTHPMSIYPVGDSLPHDFTGYWDDWADDGEAVYKYQQAGDSVTLLGGLTATYQDGQALVTLKGPAGAWPCKTVLFSILLAEWQDGGDTDGDGMDDAVEIWRNAIWMVHEGCAPLGGDESPLPEPGRLVLRGASVFWTGGGPVRVAVYNPVGRLGQEAELEPGQGLELPGGLWIVRAGGKTLKAVVR